MTLYKDHALYFLEQQFLQEQKRPDMFIIFFFFTKLPTSPLLFVFD